MKRPKITVVNHYNIFTYNLGGIQAIKGLYKYLSKWFDINIVTIVSNEYYKKTALNKGIDVVPLMVTKDMLYSIPGTTKDSPFPQDGTLKCIRYYHRIPAVINSVREIAADSVAVIAEHVYTWRIIKEACGDKHLWYRAHNVEYDYTKDVRQEEFPLECLQEIYDIEQECCHECERILTISQNDANRFIDLYAMNETDQESLFNIGCGYDVQDVNITLPSKRKKINCGYKYTGMFIAVGNKQTKHAAECCVEIASRVPDVQILIIGSVGELLDNNKLPENVVLTGVISEEKKRYYLGNCDFALNLIEGGSGVNVKMLEYFAHGIPAISTRFGTRGIDVTDGKNCIITSSNPDAASEAVIKYVNMPDEQKDSLAQNALNLLHKKYTWETIANSVAMEIKRMYNISSINLLSSDELSLDDGLSKDQYNLKKPFYIRCAGKYGKRCAKYLKNRDIYPKAFVDTYLIKTTKSLDGIPIISISDYIAFKEDAYIIVANARDAGNIIRELIAYNVPKDNILFALPDGSVISLSHPPAWMNFESVLGAQI